MPNSSETKEMGASSASLSYRDVDDDPVQRLVDDGHRPTFATP